MSGTYIIDASKYQEVKRKASVLDFLLTHPDWTRNFFTGLDATTFAKIEAAVEVERDKKS